MFPRRGYSRNVRPAGSFSASRRSRASARRPVGTFTGWALQGPAYAAGDGCDASGQFLPFPLTRAAAKAAKDPRRSLAERYPTHEAYVRRITEAAHRLGAQRLLLPEDVASYISAAQSGTTGGRSPTTSPLPIAH